MPVYEEVYRSWKGRLIERPRTWWVIARTGVRLVWRRVVGFLLVLAYIPFLVRDAQIIIFSRFSRFEEMGPEAQLPTDLSMLSVDADFFADFLTGQWLFLMLILLTGAGLIASDRRFRALPLYFSKPVSFWDYLGGKTLIVFAYGCLVTLIPGLLLFLTKVLMAEDSTFLREYWWIPLSIAGWSVLAVGALGLLVLALSAVAKGPRPAAIYFFTLLFLLEAIRGLAPSGSDVGIISPLALISQSASLLFGTAPPYPFPAGAGVFVLVFFAAASVVVLRSQVRPTEVVR